MRCLCLTLLLVAGTAAAQADGGTASPTVGQDVRDEVRKALTVQLPVPKLPPTLPSIDKDVRVPKVVVPPQRIVEQAREQAGQQATSTTAETLRTSTIRIAEDAARTATSGQASDLRNTATQQARTASAESTGGELPAPRSETGLPDELPADIPADLPSRPTGNPRK